MKETFSSVRVRSELTPPNNSGADIVVHDEKWSLKTQADRKIRSDMVNIHKVMEAGAGSINSWEERRNLVSAFHAHLGSFNRLIMLRCLPATEAFVFPHYELIEVPVPLLQKAARFPLQGSENSTIEPAGFTVNVMSEDGQTREFQLCFDGGGERKLRVKHLRRELCVSHISWSFPKK